MQVKAERKTQHRYPRTLNSARGCPTSVQLHVEFEQHIYLFRGSLCRVQGIVNVESIRWHSFNAFGSHTVYMSSLSGPLDWHEMI